jgi:hypothetical protein
VEFSSSLSWDGRGMVKWSECKADHSPSSTAFTFTFIHYSSHSVFFMFIHTFIELKM